MSRLPALFLNSLSVATRDPTENIDLLRGGAAEVTRTHPVPDVEEALLTGQVEHQQEAHGVSEESGGEAAEPKQVFICEV